MWGLSPMTWTWLTGRPWEASEQGMVEMRSALWFINSPLAWMAAETAGGARMEASGGPVGGSCESPGVLS